jgi:hypothetical protein
MPDWARPDETPQREQQASDQADEARPAQLMDVVRQLMADHGKLPSDCRDNMLPQRRVAGRDEAEDRGEHE